jgi:hypothetical protein
LKMPSKGSTSLRRCFFSNFSSNFEVASEL